MNLPPRGLFITGTNTGVGKTYVACRITAALRAAGKRVGVYKPVASGCELHNGKLASDDAEALWQAIDRSGPIERVCPQLFAAPLAPHLAARAEGKEVDADLLRRGASAWGGECEILIVEGAGGLMSPLTDDEYVADLADDLGYPLVVVSANVLGTIHATLTTLIAAATFREGLPLAGVVLNDVADVASDPSAASNRGELERRCVAPLLTHVRHSQAEIEGSIDWWKLAKRS